MNLKLFRLHSLLGQDPESKKMNDSIINDINDALLKEDIYLTEDADDDELSVVFVETGGSEEPFLKIADKVSNPCILVTTYRDNSLPACLEIKTYLESKHIMAIIYDADSNNLSVDMFIDLAKVYKAKHELKGARLGVVGKPSDWLIASKVDYSKVKEKFGIDLIDISIEEFQKEIDKKTYGRVKHLAELKKKWKDEEVLEGALHIYGALKRLIIRYDLEGLTVRCFDLLGLYKNTSCLAFALLNEEGYIATCEGDVPSMLTMVILNKISGFSSFQANPSYISYKNQEVLFAHCTIPLDMCNSFELDTHFESGLGIGIKGVLSESEVSVCKLAPDLKSWISCEGKISENPSLKGYCRTQIRVKFERESFLDFLSTSVGNHVIISYNPLIARLFSLFLASFQDKEKE